jgi:DNA-binding MarR family transcriptional regulator
VRISERDARLLLLIAEQYAVTVDQLAQLIGRTYRTARWLRDRWQKAGWVESRQLAASGPSFLWLTREGGRVAQSPYRIWQPNPGLAKHIEAVTETRLLLERQLRLGEWQSERMLAKTYGPRSQLRLHLPDAVLISEQTRIAVEVELTLKSRARLEEIVRDLGERYQQVWYFADARLVPTLRELAAAARWQNVRVHHHPPLLSELYAAP